MQSENEIAVLTRLVALFCKAPICLISLVHKGQVHIRSPYGMDECDIEGHESFCSHTVRGEKVLEVVDTLEDERFRQLKVVTGPPNIRFYAGVPLVTPSGHVIGALCVLDHVPRKLEPQEKEVLHVMSSQVMNFISLKESEERFKDLFDNVSDIVQSISPEGDIVWVNRKWQETLGYSESERSSIKIFDIVATSCKQRCMESFRRLLNGEDVGLMDVSLIAKNGDIMHFKGKVSVRFENGKPKMTRGVFRDLTQEKNDQRELQMFKQTLDQTFDAILMYEPHDLRFIYANKSALKLTGYTLKEIKKLRPLALDAKIDRDNIKQMHLRLMEGAGKSLVFETKLRSKSGSELEVEITSQFLSDDSSPRFMALIRDITEQKKSLRQLQEAKNQAEEANDAKSRFLSRMSHELRTPLNSIIGFSKIMQMTSQGEKQLENANRIHNSGKHLLELITDVMDISRVETDELILHPEPVDISELLLTVRELMKPEAASAGVGIVCLNHGQTSLNAHLDCRRLKQILINLISNALKYKRDDCDCMVKLSARKLGDRILIDVEDNGVGIPKDKTRRLFIPFDRLDMERERSEIKGTGLGLSIVKQLVKAMGGEIHVESQIDKGSVFSLNLPALIS